MANSKTRCWPRWLKFHSKVPDGLQAVSMPSTKVMMHHTATPKFSLVDHGIDLFGNLVRMYAFISSCTDAAKECRLRCMGLEVNEAGSDQESAFNAWEGQGRNPTRVSKVPGEDA